MPTKPPVIFPDPSILPSLAAFPLVELKMQVILFVPTPPGPKTCRRVLDAYFARFGDPFVDYAPTSVHMDRDPWNLQVKQEFFRTELPQLRQGTVWGYSFWDGKTQESQSLMFHGYAPVSEEGMSSFFRFEFGWQHDPIEIREFTLELLSIVTCLSGNAGYTFVGLPPGEGAAESWDQLYAWGRRYLGVDVDDLEVTAAHVEQGFKCVSWLTAIGPALAQQAPEALSAAGAAATWSATAPGGTLVQAGHRPVLGDRNMHEDLSIYATLATALEPLQLKDYASFGDDYICRWDEYTTKGWLQRFTKPGF